VVDVARYARHIALPEIGADGQARISAARVAVVGTDLAAETALTYLRAAGVAHLIPLPAPRDPGKGQGSDAKAWRDVLSDVDVVVRSGFDDDAMSGVAAVLGLPVVAVRTQADVVDLVSFARRPPLPDATAIAPFAAAAPSDTGPAAILAGALAAAEALQVLVRAGDVHPAPRIRHLRLPLDGREPLAQVIGRPT
jgi:hypothetical protein